MFQEKKVYTTKWAGKELTVEIGEMARHKQMPQQLSMEMLLFFGNHSGSIQGSKDGDFFPLTVNYEENGVAGKKNTRWIFKKRRKTSGTEAGDQLVLQIDLFVLYLKMDSEMKYVISASTNSRI